MPDGLLSIFLGCRLVEKIYDNQYVKKKYYKHFKSQYEKKCCGSVSSRYGSGSGSGSCSESDLKSRKFQLFPPFFSIRNIFLVCFVTGVYTDLQLLRPPPQQLGRAEQLYSPLPRSLKPRIGAFRRNDFGPRFDTKFYQSWIDFQARERQSKSKNRFL